MKQVAALLLTAAILAGCSTVPVPSETATAIPADRIFDLGLTTPAADKATVVLTRDSGYLGSACAIKVFCDGKLAGGIRTKEKLVLYVSQGEHIITVRHGGGICGGVFDLAHINATLEKPQELRIGVTWEGDLVIEPIAL